MRKAVVKAKDSYFHGNLREALLKTSLRLIEKEGLERLSIREVAKAVGVTHQAPYNHFKNREELLAALAQDGFEKLFLAISPAAKSSARPLEKLIQVGERYLDWANGNPEHFRLMFSKSIPGYEKSRGLQAATDQSLDSFLSVVAENFEGVFNQSSDERWAARQIWAAMHGVTILFIDKQFKPLGQNIELGRQLVRDVIVNLVKGLSQR